MQAAEYERNGLRLYRSAWITLERLWGRPAARFNDSATSCSTTTHQQPLRLQGGIPRLRDGAIGGTRIIRYQVPGYAPGRYWYDKCLQVLSLTH